MSFCQNCGKELNEGTHFCSNCGQAQTSIPATKPARTGATRHLHCPECKSHDISPIVETEVSSGTSFNHSFSRKNSVSTMQFNNTHRNYWMCHSCGHKFRNIQNLEEEIKAGQRLVKRCIFVMILFGVFTILMTVTDGFSFFSGFNIFVVLLLASIACYIKNRIAKLIEERAYLKKHCFD